MIEFCGHFMVFMRSFCVFLARNLFADVVSHYLSMKIYQNSAKTWYKNHHNLKEVYKLHPENLKKPYLCIIWQSSWSWGLLKNWKIRHWKVHHWKVRRWKVRHWRVRRWIVRRWEVHRWIVHRWIVHHQDVRQWNLWEVHCWNVYQCNTEISAT